MAKQENSVANRVITNLSTRFSYISFFVLFSAGPIYFCGGDWRKSQKERCKAHITWAQYFPATLNYSAAASSVALDGLKPSFSFAGTSIGSPLVGLRAVRAATFF